MAKRKAPGEFWPLRFRCTLEWTKPDPFSDAEPSPRAAMVPCSQGDYVELEEVLVALTERDAYIRRIENCLARTTRRLGRVDTSGPSKESS